jgi:hypothetical protein
MDTRILYIAQIENPHRNNSLISCAFNNEQEAIKYAEEEAVHTEGPAYVYEVEYESDAIEDRRGGVIVLDPEAYVEADLIWSTDPQAPNVADADYEFDPYYGPQVYTENLKENVSREVIYSVNSDLDDGILYAEFETKDAAIEYAKRNLDKLPFVDELQVSRDANGEVDDVFEYKTVWDHTRADDTTEEPEDKYWEKPEANYWDELEIMYDAEEDGKHVIGDTNDLVEAMEENEDMVECKECFELFPKADCTKLEVGYICPTCSDHCCDDTNDDSDVDIILVADEDTFKVDFPEYEKFRDTEDEFDDSKLAMSDEDVARVNEPFEGDDEPELTPEEAVPFLVKDEEEAIAGYEKAAEVIETSDVENKEEILDTLDHIKEEEEEHIEELTDLVDDEIIEVENDPISDEEEIETIEDPESTVLNEDTTSETKYWMCWYDGNDAAVVEAATEEEAEWTFMDDYSDEYFFDSWDHDWSVEEISKEEYDEYLALNEHINKENPAIESDQELKGIDNAIVDCEVAKVITHSEDEKPVDCKGKKRPLKKPLTEAAIVGRLGSEADEIDLIEFTELCKEIGIKTVSDLDYFIKNESDRPGTILDKLKSYRAELGPDFKITNEELKLTHGFDHIKSVARLVHDAVIRKDKGVKVWTHESGMAFYVATKKANIAPESLKQLILDTLAENGYEPEKVELIDKGDIYGFLVSDIIIQARMTMSYQKTEGCRKPIREEPLTETFTKEEQEEYNMDENGVSLDGYDEYVRCTWCGEIFTVDSCVFEANMGWLCDRCYQAILSRGEKLTIIKNPTDEDIARTLTEEVKMTTKELKDKFGTDNVDLINAGREPEERVELEEAVGGEIKMPFSDLSKEEQEYIKDFTKFINDAIANKTELTADDILKFKDNYSKNIVNNK